MSSYGIYVADDTNSNFSVVAFRAPATLMAGGTRLSIPWVTNANAAATVTVISAATTATPISATAAGHGLATGDVVQVFLNSATASVLNIVGTYTVTVSSSSVFTLDNSVGSGTYTASTASVKPLVKAKDIATAVQAGLRACLDDRASGN